MSFPPYTYTRTQQFLPPLWVVIMQDEYCRSDYHVNRKATFSFAVASKKCINHDFQFRTHFNKKRHSCYHHPKISVTFGTFFFGSFQRFYIDYVKVFQIIRPRQYLLVLNLTANWILKISCVCNYIYRQIIQFLPYGKYLA